MTCSRSSRICTRGRMNGYLCQGFNALAAFPNKAKLGTALAKLKYLVVIDPLATETSEFWQNFGEYNDVDPAKIQTTVFSLPCGLLRRRGRGPCQFGTVAAMALEGGGTARRSKGYRQRSWPSSSSA